MNNEQAMIIIGNLPIEGDGCYSIPEYQEAKTLAIKALEQEPCEKCCGGNQEEKAKLCQKSYLAGMEHKAKQQPCEDAISRQDAIRVASGYCYWSNIPEELAKLPSVSTEKTGHWEQYGYFWENKFKCSECGKEQPKILCGEQIIGHWSDFCPNCGAKMEAEE